jgi:hypothetical protein
LLWFQMSTKDISARGARFVEKAPEFIVEDALSHARVLLDGDQQ